MDSVKKSIRALSRNVTSQKHKHKFVEAISVLLPITHALHWKGELHAIMQQAKDSKDGRVLVG